MKRGIWLMFLCILPACLHAQDPGQPDSLIIGTVSAVGSTPSVMVSVYAVTDDSIAFINLPIRWQSTDNKMNVAGVYYFDPLIYWDLLTDTIDMAGSRLYVRGVHDIGGGDNPVLNTASQRRVIMRLRVVIHTGAADQFFSLVPYTDSTRGAPQFAVVRGTASFTPVIRGGGVTYQATAVDDKTWLPTELFLDQNYPNPFNSRTEIRFSLAYEGNVTLDVFDLLGRKVCTLVDRHLPAGQFLVSWDGTDSRGQAVSSGVYLYSLRSDKTTLSRKMLLIK